MQYADGELSAGTHNDPQNPIDNTFNRSWAIVDDDPIKGMKKVDVTVTYQTGSPDSSVTLNTLITSRR